MTANQINFFKAKEEAKHWRRQDKETQRHNVESENLTGADISIKDWANRENVRLGYTNAEINRTHYEKSDFNNQVNNQIKTDQLVLEAINTLGKPQNADGLILFDYYAEDPYLSDEGWLKFSGEPLQYSYTTPQAFGQYGKALSGVSSGVKTGYSIVNDLSD